MVDSAMNKDLKISNNLAEIERLDVCVRAFGIANGLEAETVKEIQLVMEELLTNIISYGYEDEAGHDIDVSIVNGVEAVTIRVQDDARPFNLLNHPRPNLEIPLEDRRIGGVGINIVCELMDEIKYTREENTNIVVLRKRKL